MENSTIRAADDLFGPFVKPITNSYFDFTRFFEELVFSIGPSAIFLLIVPLRLVYLARTPRKVRRSSLAIHKLILLAFFTSLQIACLALWTTPTAPRTRASFAAAASSLVATIGLTALSYVEHAHSPRPSVIINLYLLLTLPLDFAQVRSLWLRRANHTLVAVFTCSIAVKAVILVVEAIEKKALLLLPFRSWSSEATSGLYSRAAFWWLNPLFLSGYKHVLSDATLLSTDEKLMSDPIHQQFQRRWTQYQPSPDKTGLLRALAGVAVLPLITAVLPRVLMIFFKLMQPLLIRRVSKLVGQPMTRLTSSEGWGLTGAYGLVYLGIAFSTAIYYHQNYRMIAMVRGALASAIYTKSLELSTTALDESAAVTLVSTDVQRICDSLVQLHEVWANAVQITLGVWLLTREIGVALLGPLIITVASVFASMAVSKHMAPAQKSWIGAVQTRIDATSKILESMKSIKMLGLTPTITHLLEQLRTREIDVSLKFRKLFCVCIILANVSSCLGPGVAFILYVITGQAGHGRLDVSRAFTALSLISLVSGPAVQLVFAVPPLIASLGSVERIQKFLLSATRTDHRIVLATTTGESHRPSQVQSTTKGDIELQTLQPKQDSRRNTLPPVRLINASFSWSVGASPVVKDISFELKSGALTFLIGPIGCGKTSVLRGILGEIPSAQGFVYVDSMHAAFVQQAPWIQHKTIRQNIVGVSLFNQSWYDTVLRACALERDIAELPQRDQTIVGSGGHSLSGGQRLRVSLARAVYSRQPLLILDDPFSGLDADSEERVFRRLLGRHGLIRKQSTTVLLASHAVHRLSYADNIIALNPEGTIAEEGTFTELMGRSGYVSSLAARHKADNREVDDNTDPKQDNKDSTASPDSSPEESLRQTGDVEVYKYYFASIGWTSTAIYTVLIVLFAFFSLFPELWMKFWTSAVAKHGASVNGLYLAVYVSLGVIALLCVFGLGLQLFIRMVPTSARNLHHTLLATVMAAPLSFLTSTPTGQTLNRFSQDLELVDMELPSALIQVTGPLCLGIIQAIFICFSAAYFVTTLPPVIGVMYFLQKYYLRTSRQIRLLDLESKSPLFGHILETLSGLVTIRAFGWTEEFQEQNIILLDKSQKPFYLLLCIQRWLALVLDLIVAALAVILMVLIVKLREKLDSGFVALGLLNIMSFNNNLTAIVQMWTGLETSLGAIARLKDFSKRTPSENPAEECGQVAASWPQAGEIQISQMSASYALDSPDVLKGINLSIRSGERIGICGASGSGKSSLIASLYRMLEIRAGTITIDGVDICQLPRQTVRERLNAIPQDHLFFPGTIRQNIDHTERSTEDAIETALRRVGVWNIVASTPKGLDSEMNAEELLSPGQRQLFCLARAMIRPANIVILDEATASVDILTDKLMQEIIRESFSNCTIIAVAHRLQTVVDFDRIVVMQSGRIVEEGKPQVLLEDGNSYFRRLWDS